MKNTKWKYIVKTLVIASVLVSLLVSLNGCKKKPEATEPSSTGETVAETTDSTENTKPSVNVTETTTETTSPVETTTETTVAVCEHVLGAPKVDVTSNCTREGSRYIECTLCGEKVVTESIPMTAHTPSEWKGTKATCTQEGAQYKECTQCKEKLISIIVDKADHATKCTPGYAATATTPGRTDYYWCKNDNCNFEQKHYAIPAEGTVPYQTKAKGSTCTITGLGSWTGSELILPEKIDGMTVTAIGSNAFANCTSIKTIYIPKTVTEIGDKAFSGCSAITTIVYEGAMKDWVTSVVKGNQWNQNTGSYQIHCNNKILSK